MNGRKVCRKEIEICFCDSCLEERAEFTPEQWREAQEQAIKTAQDLTNFHSKLKAAEPQEFILMDLERTIGSGTAFYWKAHGRGYTPDVKEAGIYSYEAAREHALEDQDLRTVIINMKTVRNILRS